MLDLREFEATLQQIRSQERNQERNNVDTSYPGYANTAYTWENGKLTDVSNSPWGVSKRSKYIPILITVSSVIRNKMSISFLFEQAYLITIVFMVDKYRLVDQIYSGFNLKSGLCVKPLGRKYNLTKEKNPDFFLSNEELAYKILNDESGILGLPSVLPLCYDIARLKADYLIKEHYIVSG